MKTALLATTALALGIVSAAAADMAPRYTKAPPMVAPAWNWSGFYIGGNVGYGVTRSPTDNLLLTPTTPPIATIGATGNIAADGVIGGGQIGWNTMFAPAWLFGIEADIQASDQRGALTAFFGAVPPLTFATESRLNWFGTVRARLGWTATPETLFYVTGGYAYGEVETTNSSSTPIVGGPTVLAGSTAKSIKDGWTVGGGVEARLWNSNWTGKLEYLYMDLGSQGTANLIGPGLTFTQASNVDFKDHIFRVGLNYKLGNWAY